MDISRKKIDVLYQDVLGEVAVLIDRLEAVNAQSIENATNVERTVEKLVRLEKSRRLIAIFMIAVVVVGAAVALGARAYETKMHSGQQTICEMIRGQ